MNSAERILTALAHKEADRIPFDLGGTHSSGINVHAYRALLDHLGIEEEVKITNLSSQLAEVGEQLCDLWGIDTRGMFPRSPSTWKLQIEEEGDYRSYFDEWGIKWMMPKEGGHYYDMRQHPLQGCTIEDLDKYSWPNPRDPARIEGLRDEATRLRESGRAVLMAGTIGNGFLHTGNWLEGYEDFFADLAGDPDKACKLMDKVLELKLNYWDMVLGEVGDLLHIVCELDDLGTQGGPLVSPDMYRRLIKPRQQQLFSFIKKRAPHVKIYFHSCGSVYHFIGDLIEVGVDILNPVQVAAADMDTKRLKKEFGQDIVFWGGGVDTQRVLPYGTPQEVRDEVKRRIDDLAPGGGFVFSTVHNIQGDVPPENIVAVWETLQEYGRY
ncbi:MAG: uroporphyrinogen-III decarboxylase [Firmicutes bacterium]|jgi:uroporphyrinogen decarboxylase|nr:uroporphyrinogen-III decarboxylase [Bacillota bacterium]